MSVRVAVVLGAVSGALACATVILAVRTRDQGRAINDLRDTLGAQIAMRARADGVAEASALMEAARARNIVPAQPVSFPPALGPESQANAQAEKTKGLDSVELRNHFAALFTEEPIDPVWAPERKSTLSSRLQSALPSASILKGVECHSSLCRVETVHQDVAGYQAFLDSAFRDPGTKVTTGGIFATLAGKDEEGRLVATVFVAAEGQSLPRIDAQ